MNYKYLILIFFLITIGGCNGDFSRQYPDFGLPRVELEIGWEELGELNNSSNAKRPVDAQLTYMGKNYNIGVHHAGKSTLDAFKKSYQIILKDRQYRGRSELRLSSQFSDPTLVRAPLGFEVFENAGISAPFVETVVLFINGEYEGIYQMIEPVDDEFFTNRNISVENLYKAKFGNAGFQKEFLPKLEEAYSIKSENKSWVPMQFLWEQVNMGSPNLALIEAILDVDQYLDYIAVCVILNHWDGYNNNYFLAFSSKTRKFRIYPWDLDRIFEDRPLDEQNLWGGNQLTKVLMSFPIIREKFIHKVEKIKGTYDSNSLSSRASALANTFQDAYESDVYLSQVYEFSDSQQKLQRNIDIWLSFIGEKFASMKNTGP